MTTVISAHPLPASFSKAISEAADDEPTFANLAELRRKPRSELVQFLRRSRGCNCVLALFADEERALLPLLEAFAALLRPAQVGVFSDNLHLRPISRAHAPFALGAVLTASTDGAVAVRRARRELETLVAAPRADVRLSDNRRIVYVNANLWMGMKAGGSIGHVSGVVNALGEAGYTVDLATMVPPIGINAGAVSHALDPPTPFGLPFEATYYRTQRSLGPRLERIAQGAPIGFVYQRMSVGNYAGALLSRRLGVPFVLEYNGSEVWIAANWGQPLRYEREARLAEEACLAHAHLVVTVSETLRSELIDRGVEPARIVAYPNGVDPVKFDTERLSVTRLSELRTQYSLSPNTIVVGFVGTFGQWHGSEVLAQAIAQLTRTSSKETAGRDVRFLLVGDGLRMPAVRTIIEQAGASGNVVFTGLVPQEDAPAHLGLCDILVSPHVPNADGSPFFGSPTKLFEYMAAAKTIVASRLDQIADVLDPSLDVAALPHVAPTAGDTARAILAEPGDADALARGIRFAIDKPEWRHTLGRNARTAVLDHYTWDHHVKAFLDQLAMLHGAD